MLLKTILRSHSILLIVFLAMGSPAKAEDVCFTNKIRDDIKINCKKYKGKLECLDENGAYKAFTPGADWEEIDGDDPRCQPRPEDRHVTPRGEGGQKKNKGD